MKAGKTAPAATGKPSATPHLDALLRSEPDLVDRIFDYVVELVPQIAQRKEEVKAALREEFGGERRYVSKRPSSAERDLLGSQILSLFNGRNATEVARKLKIHRTTVYRYLKQPGRR
jgi:Mor family transcriptional regulator